MNPLSGSSSRLHAAAEPITRAADGDVNHRRSVKTRRTRRRRGCCGCFAICAPSVSAMWAPKMLRPHPTGVAVPRPLREVLQAAMRKLLVSSPFGVRATLQPGPAILTCAAHPGASLARPYHPELQVLVEANALLAMHWGVLEEGNARGRTASADLRALEVAVPAAAAAAAAAALSIADAASPGGSGLTDAALSRDVGIPSDGGLQPLSFLEEGAAPKPKPREDTRGGGETRRASSAGVTDTRARRFQSSRVDDASGRGAPVVPGCGRRWRAQAGPAGVCRVRCDAACSERCVCSSWCGSPSNWRRRPAEGRHVQTSAHSSR
jgi:hypothetical protein